MMSYEIQEGKAGEAIPLSFFQYREKEILGIDMETDECIGICETDDKGHIIKIER